MVTRRAGADRLEHPFGRIAALLGVVGVLLSGATSTMPSPKPLAIAAATHHDDGPTHTTAIAPVSESLADMLPGRTKGDRIWNSHRPTAPRRVIFVASGRICAS